MGIVLKQSLANAIITYTGIALGFVLTVLLYPHILNPDQYGLTRVLISASFISSQFAHLGVRNSIIKFFPFFKKVSGKDHGMMFWILLIPLIGFLLFSLLFWVFQGILVEYYIEQSPLFVEYYLWILPITLFLLYFEVFNSYLRSLRDSTSGSLVNEVLQRIFIILFLALYSFGVIDFFTFILLFALSYAAQPLILITQIYRLGELRLTPNFSILRKPLVKGISNYGLYSLLGGLTTILVWNIDIMMLGSMAGLADTAVYAIAFYIASVITVPQRSIEKIAAPLVSEYIENNNWDQVDQIYKKTSLNQALTGLLVFGLIWLNADILFWILPDEYAAGLWVILIIGIGKLIDLIAGLNGTILVNSKHYRVTFYTNLFLAAVTIAANYILIPVYGINGAALATTFSIFFYNAVKHFYVWWKLNTQPLTGKTGIVLLLGTIGILLPEWLIHFEMMIPELAVKSILFLLIFLLPVLYFELSKDFNTMIKQLLHKTGLI
ncbi:lipopolysaccharide biosynthesis protein [Rhodohalobacter sp. SW132]|uniref:lipopolysaccharide biosynthesis protein n=1 Tax=Rhodohalobacter sp. SW132 TaxID=2293433 RepID=UPI001315A4AE|nr:polysaccharide biosynthesis C-terminal domain-containing protein [Rhodohalobacter sp. SW132]